MTLWTVFDANGVYAYNLMGDVAAGEVPEDHYLFSGLFSEDYYRHADTGMIDNRLHMNLTVGGTDIKTGDVFQVSDIPPGTQVSCSTGSMIIDDGFFEWSSATPGPETFTLKNFPYKDEVIYVNVTDA